MAWLDQLTIYLFIDPGVAGLLAFLLFLGMAIVFVDKAPAWIHMAVGAAVLAGLFIPIGVLFAEDPSNSPLEYVKAAAYFLLLLSLFVAGDLFFLGVHSPLPHPSASRWRSVVGVLLGLAIFAKLLQNIYWLIIWDKTYDPLGVLWMFLPILCAVIAALVLLVRLPNQWRLAGLAYLVVGPACLVAIFLLAKQVDFKALTIQRAQRVVQAVQAYRQRTGSYPTTLVQLPWWQRQTLPGPINFYGQDWCYQGGKNYFRLGFLDQDHWSSPVRFGRVVASQGQDPNSGDVCQAAIDAYQGQISGPDKTSQKNGQPTPVSGN